MSLDLSVSESGAAEGTRTPDPIITNDVLYHLSYSGQFYAPVKTEVFSPGITAGLLAVFPGLAQT